MQRTRKYYVDEDLFLVITLCLCLWVTQCIHAFVFCFSERCLYVLSFYFSLFSLLVCFHACLHVCPCLSVAGATSASNQLWRWLNSVFRHSDYLPDITKRKAAFWLARSPLPVCVQVVSFYYPVQAGLLTDDYQCLHFSFWLSRVTVCISWI